MAVYNQNNNSNSTLSIYVYAEKLSASDTADEKSTNPSENEEDDSEQGRHKISKAKLKKSVNTARAIANISTRQLPNLVIGQFATMTGDSNYQAMVQRNVERFQDTAQSIIGVGTTAALLGPQAAVFAAVGVAFSLASKYEQRNIETGLSQWKAQQSINYAKARSGVDITDGRTRLR